MQYIPCNSALLAHKTLFLTQKTLFLPKDLQKVRKLRQILICDKIAYVWAQNFRPSPNFSAVFCKNREKYSGQEYMKSFRLAIASSLPSWVFFAVSLTISLIFQEYGQPERDSSKFEVITSLFCQKSEIFGSQIGKSSDCRLTSEVTSSKWFQMVGRVSHGTESCTSSPAL